MYVDISSASHPFYTGKQKFVDTAGRVEKFRQRYAWQETSSDEVLSGELPDSQKVTVAHPVLLRVPDDPNFDDVPLSVPPVETLRRGIELVDQGAASPRYLVFARYGDFSQGRRALTFFGPGSVAEVGEDGVIVATEAGPFVFADASNNAYGQDMTIEFVRRWIKGEPPAVVVPQESKPTDADAPENPPGQDFESDQTKDS